MGWSIQVILLVLLAIQALVFSVTVSRYGTNAVLRYPVADRLSWVEVCVAAEGFDPKSPDREGWESNSCWVPRFKVEQLDLDEGTTSIKARLEISEDGYRSTLHTPVIFVRPKPPTD